MPRPASNKPTEGELEILHVLWSRGPQTAREITRALDVPARGRSLAYQSIHTRLGLMEKKRFVHRDGGDRPAKFSAAVTEAQARRTFFRAFVKRFFKGSSVSLVMHALKSGTMSEQERATIKQKLDHLKRERG